MQLITIPKPSNLSITDKEINLLAKKYNTLTYFPQLIELLKSVYPTEDFTTFSKYDLHHSLNHLLITKYKGEQTIKYKLCQRHLKKRNFTGAFEIKVNSSRADFLTINGHTTSYEIKSELDNFTKFKKQALDYLQVFEFNNLLVDEKHVEKAQEMVPKTFGVWSYSKGRQKQIKKAEKSDLLDPIAQLKLLTKKELRQYFPEFDGQTSLISTSLTPDIINSRFKKTLKNRYRERWEFIIKYQASILPIDFQFFFNTNIEPDYIYRH
jgi:hypothetical protein